MRSLKLLRCDAGKQTDARPTLHPTLFQMRDARQSAAYLLYIFYQTERKIHRSVSPRSRCRYQLLYHHHHHVEFRFISSICLSVKTDTIHVNVERCFWDYLSVLNIALKLLSESQLQLLTFD